MPKYRKWDDERKARPAYPCPACPECNQKINGHLVDLIDHIYDCHEYAYRMFTNRMICWCGEEFQDTPGTLDAEDQFARHLENVGVENLADHYLLGKMGAMHDG